MIRPLVGALSGRFRADPVDEALGPGDPYPGADPGLQRQAGPDPHAGLPWIDPAVAPCLHKLARYGRFVFHGSRDPGPPGPGASDARPAVSGRAGEDTDPVLDTVEEFVTGVRPVPGVPGSWEIFAVAG